MVELNMNFTDSFFEEEARCGYKISSKMKQLWAVELDLLNELIRVCTKYEIQYYACAGTILGVVRHNGYIPWDDDIDIMMDRKNYDRLCSLAKKEFKSPYFFQTEYNDPGCIRGHAQLRNCETTCIQKSELDYKYKFNQGVFIDIFPIDALPDDPQKRKQHINKMIRFKKNMIRFSEVTTRYSPLKRTGIKGIIIKMIAMPMRHVFRNYNPYYRLFEKEAKKYDNCTSKEGCIAILYSREERFVWNFEDLKNPKQMQFEMLTICIPGGYENMLKKTYGDWEKYQKGGSMHSGIIFDIERSYRDFLS